MSSKYLVTLTGLPEFETSVQFLKLFVSNCFKLSAHTFFFLQSHPLYWHPHGNKFPPGQVDMIVKRR